MLWRNEILRQPKLIFVTVHVSSRSDQKAKKEKRERGGKGTNKEVEARVGFRSNRLGEKKIVN